MGGSKGIMGGLQGLQSMFPQQPVTPPSQSQILDYAKSNSGDFGAGQSYQAELAKQIRSGSYQDPYKVWANVMAAKNQPENQGGTFASRLVKGMTSTNPESLTGD